MNSNCVCAPDKLDSIPLARGNKLKDQTQYAIPWNPEYDVPNNYNWTN